MKNSRNSTGGRPNVSPDASAAGPSLAPTGTTGTVGLGLDEGSAQRRKEDANKTFDVFISVHVGSLGNAAKELKAAIEALGYSAFLCSVDIPGGGGFREEIVRAVKSCKVY